MIDNPTALVTGANKGLGRETARQLAAAGATVLLGSRDLQRGEAAGAELAAAGLRVVPVRLDVTDVDGVEKAAERIRREFGRLDILVNNAGGIVESPALSTTAADVRATYETNVFGVVTVTHTMLPLLAVSAAARIVNVSSTTASLTVTSEPGTLYADADHILPYASSKAALNMLTVQYAQAFRREPGYGHIKINSASPGLTATDLTHHAGARTVEEGARIIVKLATLPDDGPSGGYFDEDGPAPW
ncbi:SDR family NAD(P)-dependent oxidoreductase [Actinacidiphila glaucinigra]|uniref:SDR family NAD(P)-dependent oxidoreductase n=1 Tax=Actinacidiphila glaucinigra TaxID=235986 RepID=UPI00381BBD21